MAEEKVVVTLDNFEQRLMVSTLPWLFSDYQAAEDAFYGAGGKFINSILEEKGPAMSKTQETQ